MSELADSLPNPEEEQSAIIIQFPVIIRPEAGYQPRPTDKEIEEIVDEYMGWSPADLALSGLSKNMQEVIARVHLKEIKDNPKIHLEDLLLWTEYYTGISEPTEKTYN